MIRMDFLISLLCNSAQNGFHTISNVNNYWLFVSTVILGIAIKGIAPAPNASPIPPVPDTTPFFVIPYKRCPPDVDGGCVHGDCELKFEMGQWKGPLCRCHRMYYGRRCELFRPPDGLEGTGMLSEAQTTGLIAGCIFIAFALVVGIICVFVGVKWYRNKQRQRSNDCNFQQPLMNGQPNGSDVINSKTSNVNNNNNNNNNNNEEELVPMKAHADHVTPLPISKDYPIDQV